MQCRATDNINVQFATYTFWTVTQGAGESTLCTGCAATGCLTIGRGGYGYIGLCTKTCLLFLVDRSSGFSRGASNAQ